MKIYDEQGNVVNTNDYIQHLFNQVKNNNALYDMVAIVINENGIPCFVGMDFLGDGSTDMDFFMEIK